MNLLKKTGLSERAIFWIIISLSIILVAVMFGSVELYRFQNARAEATLVAVPTMTAESLEFLYQKGLGYINIEHWQQAKTTLELVFEIDPNYKDVQTKLIEINAQMARLNITSTPVPSDMKSPTGTVANRLIAYYPFNGNANDESGNGNRGKTFNVTLTEDRFGNPNSACDFDGLSSYIDFGNRIFDQNVFSFSLWFKTDKDKYAQALIGNYVSCSYSNTGFVLIGYGTEAEGGPRIQLKGSNDVIPISRSVSDGRWHHVVGVFEDDSFLFYFDNELIDRRLRNYSPTKVPLKIGVADVDSAHQNCAYGKGSYFDGVLDDLRIYNYGLSAEEVRNLYEEDGKW